MKTTIALWAVTMLFFLVWLVENGWPYNDYGWADVNSIAVFAGASGLYLTVFIGVYLLPKGTIRALRWVRNFRFGDGGFD